MQNYVDFIDLTLPTSYSCVTFCTAISNISLKWFALPLPLPMALISKGLPLSVVTNTHKQVFKQNTKYLYIVVFKYFLSHCMECRRSLAMRILSVRPSVCLSVTRVNCDKTVERSVRIYIPYERTFSLVFWEKEWLVGGGPLYLKYWVNRPPLEQNRWFSTNNCS